MRRKDREVSDWAGILAVVSQCKCCRLGFYDDGEIYILPLNFGYAFKEDELYLYFHGAKEGRKIELIKRGGSVGFEMDCAYEFILGESACNSTAHYQSIIGNGDISFVAGYAPRLAALKSIMRQQTGQDDWHFEEAALDSVAIFEVKVTKLSCKIHS